MLPASDQYRPIPACLQGTLDPDLQGLMQAILYILIILQLYSVISINNYKTLNQEMAHHKVGVKAFLVEKVII